MHTLIIQQISPLLVVGFLFLAFSMIGAMLVVFWLYKRSEKQAKQIRILKRALQSSDAGSGD